jgi:chlorobactene glucosyltransferase
MHTQQSFIGMLRPLLLALPWLLIPLLVAWRLRGTPRLELCSPAPIDGPGAPVPLVSVVLPARNEAVHIAECVASLRATTWPHWQLVVVNDNSTDETGALARAAAAGDPRVTVLDAPPLPDGWFGKQWACHVGREAALGDLLLFTDADTRHHPELIARLVQARVERQADLISVAGRQEMRTVWERAVQPVVFALILTRYGGARAIEQARTPADVVANGQCFLVTADAYAAIGGHAAVRDTVVEDLMLAQRTVAHGRRVSLTLGQAYLSTRMYDGLGAIVRGWRKNVYAGGRLAIKGGWLGRRLFPLLLIGFPLAIAAPFLIAPVAWWQQWTALLTWSLAAGLAQLAAFAAAARFDRAPFWRALLAPIGALAFAAIGAQAIARGRRVEWKDREYTSV